MTTAFVFSDFNQTTLAAGIGPSAVSITVSPGTGAAFPSPGADEQFALTLNDAATRLVYEIVYCTARSGDVLTVVRGQEGTTPQTWVNGDFCWNGITSGQMNELVQVAHMTDATYSPVFSGLQVNTNTFFGTGGQFFIDPNSGGNQLIQFASGQFLALISGLGFDLVTTGQISLVGPTGIILDPYATMITGALGSGNSERVVNLADFPHSFETSGYTTLPNGLILQWGFTSSGAVLTNTETEGGLTWFFGSAAVSFPEAFPNNVWSVVATPQDDTGHLLFNANISPGGMTVSGFSAVLHTTATDGHSVNFFWMAIGD